MANTSGLKRADYYKDFNIPKSQKKEDKAKGANKGTSILTLIKQKGPANTIVIVPRKGGLVSLVVQGPLFRELRPTLETAVPALRPNPDGTLSNTAREMALRIGYGTSENGWTHNIEGVMRTLIAIVGHTYYHRAQQEGANLTIYTCQLEDTNVANGIGARVVHLSMAAMRTMMQDKSVPRATLRTGVAIGELPQEAGGNVEQDEAVEAGGNAENQARVKLLIHSNYYRFKETLAEQEYQNQRLDHNSWAWTRVLPNAQDAVTELCRIHAVLDEPSMVLAIAEEDANVREAWEEHAAENPCIMLEDTPYLHLSEMGL